MALKHLKEINKRTKYTVCGWIRRKEKSLTLQNITSLISSICILYSREDEVFHVISNNGIKVSENKKMISKIDGKKGSNNNYGITKVSSTSNFTYRWNLKFINEKGTGLIYFGIASKLSPNSHLVEVENNVYYGFHSCAKFSHTAVGHDRYGKSGYGKGDEISIILDLTQKEIKLVINGEDQGIAFGNVQKSDDITYQLFVELWAVNDCVEIVDFSKY